jgi:hypothetical protein
MRDRWVKGTQTIFAKAVRKPQKTPNKTAKKACGEEKTRFFPHFQEPK